MSKPTDLVQGTLDLLILRVLSLEAMHGWAIAQRIRQMSNEQLRVGQSALYPALQNSNSRGGSRLNGPLARTIVARSTKSSPRLVARR
jgi:PadR family transcriptional regulator PadR